MSTRQKLSLRECQQLMVNAIVKHKRYNIFASPGTGKTSAVLYALSSLDAIDGDVFPVLVVAPKRVANAVWTEEVEKWEGFEDIRVTPIIGSRKERYAAMQTPSEIYTVNPANLKWLCDTLGSRWDFKTVVVDESTIIKSHRCSLRQSVRGDGPTLVGAGAVNSTALVKRAPKTNRWYNLTGTPTPNGLKDLWGQQFPLDLGSALGRSFSAFSSRWFAPVYGSKPEQGRIRPLPNAEREITKYMKPWSLVIDAYDYFDITKPIELDIKVELPPKARRLYNQIHKESIGRWEIMQASETVTAVNAGAVIIKCRQVSSGHVRDDDGAWHEVHKAKIEALAELKEKIGDSNLIVAYWFKKDLEMIKKAFPDAVVLPSDKTQAQVQKDWNDGKIPMLLLNPQSAGHGLSLQHGGNHLCIYTVDWNSEYYEQVIERLGPTRQAQSGYKRPVYVHRIVGEKTWDEIILKRLKGKVDFSQAFKDAVSLIK